MKVSAFIITYNEEADIEKCLSSLLWCDDVVVLDSHSVDGTVDKIMPYSNVRVYKRDFDDYSTQRNWGLKSIKFKYDFLLILDADETCNVELNVEIESLIEDDEVTAFTLRRNNFFNDTFLMRNSLHHCRSIRLINHKKCYFYGKIHEKVRTEGKIRNLESRLNHYQYSKGLHHWISRRNNYSEHIANSCHLDHKLKKHSFFSENPEERRMYLKYLYMKLPCYWMVFFMYNFFVKWCFLDGKNGIDMVLLETFSEYMVAVKKRVKE